MSANSKIEWTDHTQNFWEGCTRVSPACDNCYAAARAARYHSVEWDGVPRRTKTWREPYRWDRDAAAAGRRARVFTLSLGDFFDNQAPSEWRTEAWKVIGECQNLDWLILTKRPQNIARMLPAGWPWPHAWLGVTAENMVEWDRRVPILTAIPAAVHFVSVEPMLEPVVPDLTGVDWVICGGETDPQRKGRERHMDPDWARDLLQRCQAAGVAYFMKQMSGKAPIPADLMVRQWPIV